MPRKRNTETDLIVSAGAAPARRKAATRSRARTVETTDTPAAESATLESGAVIDSAAVDSYEVADAPAREEIAALAYSYWEGRGYQGGSAEDDWLRAEAELRTRTEGALA
jgi:hypothetical protein